MADHVSLSRNQERFLQALLLGQSIAEAARAANVAERTGYRWLEDPVIQVERKRREVALAEAEQAEIERILTSGYAAMHNRVQDLDRMAHLIEQSWHDQSEPEKIIWQWLTPEKLREWRGMLDDIARELGQRAKVSKADVTSAGEKLDGPQFFFYMPEVDKGEEGEVNDGDNA